MDSRPNIALVPVSRDLDVTSVGALRATLDALIDGGCRRIVLNMAGASYVDSAGMALLLVETRRMRRAGGLMSMINVSGQVLAALKRSRLVDFVPVSGGDPRQQQVVQPLEATTLPLWRRSLPINHEDLAHTRALVGELLKKTRLTGDEAFDAGLAVGEAMGNAVDHAGGSEAQVTVTGYDDRVVMEVTDGGPGFDLDEVEGRPADSCAERGRGIRMMRLLADQVSIGPRAAGPGTAVRLVKMAHGE